LKQEKRILALYLILVFAISIPIETIWIAGTVDAGIVQLLMLVPAIVAIILKLIFFRKQSILGLGIGKPIYYLYAVLIPLAYIGLSYLLYWLFVPETFAGIDVLVETISNAINIQDMPVAMMVGFVVVIILTNIPFTFGEEAGWRGLMYPIMHKLWGRNKALIISGCIWAIWHLPALVSGDYMAGATILYRIPMFVIHILAATVIVSWLRVKSNSIWPAVLWHTMHNFLDQASMLMTSGLNRAYFVSETGFITTLLAVLFAVLILVFGKFQKTYE